MPLAERLARWARISSALALHSDHQLARRLDAAPQLASGIGGTARLLEVEGHPVFAKCVPLTARELEPAHRHSTANLFRLPAFCQYGVGSPGFGAWRELAANLMARDWVLSGPLECFALACHWRVLDAAPAAPPAAAALAEIERSVAFWHGAPAMRERLLALAQAPARLVLFLEYIPHTVHDWLGAQLAAGDGAFEAACAMVEQRLLAELLPMNQRGLLHFDAHLRNILTDGQQLFYADLGLATSPRFELAPDERDFVQRHAGHDTCHALTQLVNLIVKAYLPAGDAGSPAERNAQVRRCAEGTMLGSLPASLAELVRRHAPMAAVMNDFYWTLHAENRAAPYPAKALEQACGGRFAWR
jgi:hypothetical protein